MARKSRDEVANQSTPKGRRSRQNKSAHFASRRRGRREPFFVRRKAGVTKKVGEKRMRRHEMRLLRRFIKSAGGQLPASWRRGEFPD